MRPRSGERLRSITVSLLALSGFVNMADRMGALGAACGSSPSPGWERWSMGRSEQAAEHQRPERRGRARHLRAVTRPELGLARWLEVPSAPRVALMGRIAARTAQGGGAGRWRLWRSGTLLFCLLLGTPMPASAAPFAYVTDNLGDLVSQYDAASGELVGLSPAAVPTGREPLGVAVSPDGASVYVANQGTGSTAISQYTVGADGGLLPKVPATVDAGLRPTWVVVGPDGRSAYVTNVGDGTVSQFDIGPGGLLSPKHPASVAAGAFPQGMALSPNGANAYVARDGAISQYDVGAGGGLSRKHPPTVPTPTPRGVAVSIDGASVYVTNRDQKTISQFNVGPSGALSPKDPATVPTETDPFGLAVSPDGGSVYVANGGGFVSQYDIGPSGALSPKDPATASTLCDAYGIAIHPDGSSVYVTDFLCGYVSQYDVRESGALAPMEQSAVPAGPVPGGIALGPLQAPPPPAPEVSLSPATLNFHMQRVNTNSRSHAVTVANVGTETLGVSATRIAGPDSDEFKISGDSCTGEEVAPYGASCGIGLRFAPIATGPAVATLKIMTNAAGTDDVVLKGIGCHRKQPRHHRCRR